MNARVQMTEADCNAIDEAVGALLTVAERVAAGTPPEDLPKETASIVLQGLMMATEEGQARLDMLQGLTTAIGVYVGDHPPEDRQTMLKTVGAWLATGMLCGAQDYLIDNPKGRA